MKSMVEKYDRIDLILGDKHLQPIIQDESTIVAKDLLLKFFPEPNEEVLQIIQKIARGHSSICAGMMINPNIKYNMAQHNLGDAVYDQNIHRFPIGGIVIKQGGKCVALFPGLLLNLGHGERQVIAKAVVMSLSEPSVPSDPEVRNAKAEAAKQEKEEAARKQQIANEAARQRAEQKAGEDRRPAATATADKAAAEHEGPQDLKVRKAKAMQEIAKIRTYLDIKRKKIGDLKSKVKSIDGMLSEGTDENNRRKLEEERENHIAVVNKEARAIQRYNMTPDSWATWKVSGVAFRIIVSSEIYGLYGSFFDQLQEQSESLVNGNNTERTMALFCADLFKSMKSIAEKYENEDLILGGEFLLPIIQYESVIAAKKLILDIFKKPQQPSKELMHILTEIARSHAMVHANIKVHPYMDYVETDVDLTLTQRETGYNKIIHRKPINGSDLGEGYECFTLFPGIRYRSEGTWVVFSEAVVVPIDDPETSGRLLPPQSFEKRKANAIQKAKFIYGSYVNLQGEINRRRKALEDAEENSERWKTLKNTIEKWENELKRLQNGEGNAFIAIDIDSYVANLNDRYQELCELCDELGEPEEALQTMVRFSTALFKITKHILESYEISHLLRADKPLIPIIQEEAVIEAKTVASKIFSLDILPEKKIDEILDIIGELGKTQVMIHVKITLESRLRYISDIGNTSYNKEIHRKPVKGELLKNGEECFVLFPALEDSSKQFLTKAIVIPGTLTQETASDLEVRKAKAMEAVAQIREKKQVELDGFKKKIEQAQKELKTCKDSRCDQLKKQIEDNKLNVLSMNFRQIPLNSTHSEWFTSRNLESFAKFADVYMDLLEALQDDGILVNEDIELDSIEALETMVSFWAELFNVTKSIVETYAAEDLYFGAKDLQPIIKEEGIIASTKLATKYFNKSGKTSDKVIEVV
ncbi:MAG: hypothetical protein AB8F74_01505, partial [Saprospiraceae bacterium]